VETAEEIDKQRKADANEIYEKWRKEFIDRFCPVCESEEKSECPKFLGKYGVSCCLACRTKYVDPCPPLSALDDYYSNCKCNTLHERVIRERANDFNMDSRVSLIDDVVRSSANQVINVLEVGCASGNFLSSLKKYCSKFEKKFSFTGIDISKRAIDHSVDPSLKLLNYSAEEFVQKTADRFDVIFHFELMEHLIDPPGFMRAIHGLLKPGGYCVFTTPNAEGAELISCDYNAPRLLAHAIYPPMHLNAFSTQNITLLAYKTDFHVINISTPGKLDLSMIQTNSKNLTSAIFSRLATIKDEGTKDIVQELITETGSSSHMQCILRKPFQQK
jgi:2-polyprenyl-3-methyl-5-hydroxy-6-metoxy-1,4-benzoquinol methylase